MRPRLYKRPTLPTELEEVEVLQQNEKFEAKLKEELAKGKEEKTKLEVEVKQLGEVSEVGMADKLGKEFAATREENDKLRKELATVNEENAKIKKQLGEVSEVGMRLLDVVKEMPDQEEEKEEERTAPVYDQKQRRKEVYG